MQRRSRIRLVLLGLMLVGAWLAVLPHQARGAPITIYSTNFETQPQGWTVRNWGDDEGWRWGPAPRCHYYCPSAHSGTKCWTTGHYGKMEDYELRSPPIHIPAGFAKATLTVWTWYHIGGDELTGRDKIAVHVATDAVPTYPWYPEWPRLVLCQGWTQSDGWKRWTFDLSRFEGQTIRIVFHLWSAAGYSCGGNGWYIDDFSITVDQDRRFLSLTSGSTSPTGVFPVQGWVCGTVEWWQNPDTTPPKLYFYLDGQAIAVEQDGTGWFRFPTPSGTHTLTVEADLVNQEAPEAHRVKRFSATLQIQSRSAETVSVSVSKGLFYAGETVTIGTTYSLGYSPYWTAGTPRVLVIDSAGKTVRTLTGADVTWDGKDSAGNYCPNGTYTVKAEVTYQQPNARGSWTVSDSKTVEFRSFSISSPVVTGASGPLPPGITVPTGSLPVLVTPETLLTVACDTAGPAYSVNFVVGGTTYAGAPKNARGSPSNTWTATVGPGTQQHGATVYLTVNLRDQSGVVRATLGPLAFMVVDGRKISGASSVVSGPGYAVSGGCVYLLLDVVGEPASAPVVTAFGKSVQAAWDSSRGKWVAKVDVPSTQADGTYTAQVSVPVRMSGWPDRTVTAAVPIDVKQERLTVGSTPPRFAPRLGQQFVIPLSLRPVTSPFSTTMAVKSPAGSTVLTRTVSGLPASLSWDGKDAAGNWCDAGGNYTVEIAVKSEYDPGAGFPKGTITLTRSVTVELPNTTETEEDAPVRLIR